MGSTFSRESAFDSASCGRETGSNEVHAANVKTATVTATTAFGKHSILNMLGLPGWTVSIKHSRLICYWLILTFPIRFRHTCRTSVCVETVILINFALTIKNYTALEQSKRRSSAVLEARRAICASSDEPAVIAAVGDGATFTIIRKLLPKGAL